MLLELLSEFGAENFEVFSLLSSLLVDFDDFFINISTQEVSSLSRVSLSFLDFLQDLTNVAILAFFDSCHFIHHILQQVVDQLLGFLVTIHALIDFHSDHFAQFVSNLQLAALEPIDLILDSVVDFGNFCAQVDFLLSSGHFFLPDPAIDAPDLGFQVGVQGLNGLIFALELIAHICIHLIVSLTHFVHSLSAFFALHAFFEVHLVAHIVDLPRTLFLLAE